MRINPRFLTIPVSLIALCWSVTPVQAQGLEALTGSAKETPEQKAKKEKLMFGAGSVDLYLGAGGFFFPHLEPGIDIGIIPLPGNINLSIGANLDVGYCVGCLISGFVLDFASGGNVDWEIRSWYIAPQLRGLAHLGLISDILRLPELDLYVGIGAGPAMYYTGLKVTSQQDRNSTASAESFSWIGFGGPLAGLRYMLSDAFFIGVEARYFVSWGVSTGRVDLDGTTYDAGTDAIINDRYGTDYNLALGVRF